MWLAYNCAAHAGQLGGVVAPPATSSMGQAPPGESSLRFCCERPSNGERVLYSVCLRFQDEGSGDNMCLRLQDEQLSDGVSVHVRGVVMCAASEPCLHIAIRLCNAVLQVGVYLGCLCPGQCHLAQQESLGWRLLVRLGCVGTRFVSRMPDFASLCEVILHTVLVVA
jgi:hypothetical protein